MAEEEKAAEVVAEPVAEVKVEHAPAADSPRFKEVYARMRQAEQDRVDLQGRLARLEQQQQPRPQPQEQWVTTDQLDAAVAAGKMTPMQAADRIAWQRASAGNVAVVQQLQAANLNQTALSEVNQYMDKMPSLADVTSKEFQAVAAAAHAYSAEVGLPITDPKVQRRALRETFGSLDKIASVKSRETQVGRDTPHSEVGGGGGGKPAAQESPAAALKGVPQVYLDYWKKRGYSAEQMAEEAKYVTGEPRTVTR